MEDASNKTQPYQRVLLKLSGEAFSGPKGESLDASVLNKVAAQLKQAHDSGIELAVVIGGGFMAIYVMMRKWLTGVS